MDEQLRIDVLKLIHQYGLERTLHALASAALELYAGGKANPLMHAIWQAISRCALEVSTINLTKQTRGVLTNVNN